MFSESMRNAKLVMSSMPGTVVNTWSSVPKTLAMLPAMLPVGRRRFWGLQVGAGDSLTAIGVYTDRPATGAPYVPPAKLSPKLPE